MLERAHTRKKNKKQLRIDVKLQSSAVFRLMEEVVYCAIRTLFRNIRGRNRVLDLCSRLWSFHLWIMIVHNVLNRMKAMVLDDKFIVLSMQSQWRLLLLPSACVYVCCCLWNHHNLVGNGIDQACSLDKATTQTTPSALNVILSSRENLIE